MPNIDLTKVATIDIERPVCIDSKTTLMDVFYKSGQKRTGKLINVADIRQFVTDAQTAGVEVNGFTNSTVAQPESQPADEPVTVLASLLGLNEDQAKLLPGTNRINFWRNGQLWIQIQHGASSVKVPCTKAPTDEEIKALLFDDWKWSKLDKNRLYFRPSKEARVTL